MNDIQILSQIKKYQRKIKINNLVIIALFILILISFFYGLLNYDTNGYLFIVCILIAVISGVLLSLLGKQEKKLLNAKKEFIGLNIVIKILEEKIDIKKYIPTGFISSDIISNSSIMPNYDVISGSDYIQGTYKGVNIEFCDIHLEQIQEYKDSDGKKEKRHITVFKGHFFRMYLKKNIDGYVRIVERKNTRKKGFFSNLINSAANLVGINTNVVELENEAFNNQFEVKTNNDELAFYILTPHFMENVIHADELADGYTNILFNNSRVDISMNNNIDSFEINKNIHTQKALNEYRQIMRNDLDIILSIADEILTKNRLFE